jgi:hypothetical protein
MVSYFHRYFIVTQLLADCCYLAHRFVFSFDKILSFLAVLRNTFVFLLAILAFLGIYSLIADRALGVSAVDPGDNAPGVEDVTAMQHNGPIVVILPVVAFLANHAVLLEQRILCWGTFM